MLYWGEARPGNADLATHDTPAPHTPGQAGTYHRRNTHSHLPRGRADQGKRVSRALARKPASAPLRIDILLRLRPMEHPERMKPDRIDPGELVHRKNAAAQKIIQINSELCTLLSVHGYTVAVYHRMYARKGFPEYSPDVTRSTET